MEVHKEIVNPLGDAALLVGHLSLNIIVCAPVSYTHLDVYKRQVLTSLNLKISRSKYVRV